MNKEKQVRAISRIPYIIWIPLIYGIISGNIHIYDPLTLLLLLELLKAQVD